MKILVFLTRFPYPLNKGDKLRAFYQIKELSKANDIYLFSLTDKEPKEEDKKILTNYCKDIHIEKLSWLSRLFSVFVNLFTYLPLQTAFFTTKRAKKHFLKYYYNVKPESSYFQFVRSAEYAKLIKSYKVLDYQDCLSMNMLRRSEISSFFVKRIFLLEAKRLRNYEKQMFSLFDKLTIITQTDRDFIFSERKDEIQIIENGVDESFFDYKVLKDKRFDIIFSGNMSYKPNGVAADFLVNKIMPLVWQKRPQTNLVIAGSNPTSTIKNYAKDYPQKIFVTGWVDDMREYYAYSKIFIAPMQIGTGLQNKLLEAMAMRLPCITTPLANNALKSLPNKQILVGDTAKELADNIIKLLEDDSFAEEVASNGNDFIRQNYSWQSSCEKLQGILQHK